jgi:hypothetical protein
MKIFKKNYANNRKSKKRVLPHFTAKSKIHIFPKKIDRPFFKIGHF